MEQNQPTQLPVNPQDCQPADQISKTVTQEPTVPKLVVVPTRPWPKIFASFILSLVLGFTLGLAGVQLIKKQAQPVQPVSPLAVSSPTPSATNSGQGEKVFCQSPRPEVCTMECIQNPPYICGSDGKSYCTTCQACSDPKVEWYVTQDNPCSSE